MTNNNTSILPFFDSQIYQQHRKSYAQGQVWPLIAKAQRLPPFQVPRYDNLGELNLVTSFVVTHIDTGVQYDITANIIAAGLEIQSYAPTGVDPYDLIVYPGLTDITDVTLPDGQYDAVMSDGTTTWYSERYCSFGYVDDLVKLTYWHTRPFPANGYHISYRNPFKNFVYLQSEVNRPKYEEEEVVVERRGYRFPIQMTSKKVFRIVGLLLPEFMCDALRLVWMHTNVTIEFNGVTYVTDSCRVIFDDFEKPGHLCPAVIEFVTDTVVTESGFVEASDNAGDYNQTDYNDDHLIA